MKPLTIRSLHNRLQKLIQEPRVTLEFTEFHLCGHVAWNADVVHIKIDPDRDGSIRSILHELIHVVVDELLGLKDDRLAGELEEPAVLAWERVLWEYVEADNRRLRWWRDTINAKLEAA
jgi:hypothetical protein